METVLFSALDQINHSIQITEMSRLLPPLAVPPPRGLKSIAHALPSTVSRTTPSAESAELSLGPVRLSSSLSSKNELLEHIEKHSLGLRERTLVPADQNCWFWKNCNLIKQSGIVAPEDPDELRKAVANSLKTSKHKTHWLQHIFQGTMSKFIKFVKEQSARAVHG